MTLRPCRQCGQQPRRGDHAQLCHPCWLKNRAAHYQLQQMDISPAEIERRFQAALKRIKARGLPR